MAGLKRDGWGQSYHEDSEGRRYAAAEAGANPPSGGPPGGGGGGAYIISVRLTDKELKESLRLLGADNVLMDAPIPLGSGFAFPDKSSERIYEKTGRIAIDMGACTKPGTGAAKNGQAVHLSKVGEGDDAYYNLEIDLVGLSRTMRRQKAEQAKLLQLRPAPMPPVGRGMDPGRDRISVTQSYFMKKNGVAGISIREAQCGVANIASSDTLLNVSRRAIEGQVKPEDIGYSAKAVANVGKLYYEKYAKMLGKAVTKGLPAAYGLDASGNPVGDPIANTGVPPLKDFGLKFANVDGAITLAGIGTYRPQGDDPDNTVPEIGGMTLGKAIVAFDRAFNIEWNREIRAMRDSGELSAEEFKLASRIKARSHVAQARDYTIEYGPDAGSGLFVVQPAVEGIMTPYPDQLHALYTVTTTSKDYYGVREHYGPVVMSAVDRLDAMATPEPIADPVTLATMSYDDKSIVEYNIVKERRDRIVEALEDAPSDPGDDMPGGIEAPDDDQCDA